MRRFSLSPLRSFLLSLRGLLLSQLRLLCLLLSLLSTLARFLSVLLRLHPSRPLRFLVFCLDLANRHDPRIFRRLRSHPRLRVVKV